MRDYQFAKRKKLIFAKVRLAIIHAPRADYETDCPVFSFYVVYGREIRKTPQIFFTTSFG
jgi:hypothetical protein